MSTTTSIRLFFALDARAQAEPLLAIQQQWLQAIASTTAPVRGTSQPASQPSPVSAENLHLTLLFLGHQPTSQIPLLSQQASQVVEALALPPFAIRLDRLGLFPKARVAWMAPSQPPERLLQLEAQLRQAVIALGIPVEERPYRPHVTLLRKCQAATTAEVSPVELCANALHLYESRSTPDGVRYLQLASWPFTPTVFSKRSVSAGSAPSAAG